VGDLVAWLRTRSNGHAEALAEGAAFGAAVDRRTAPFDAPLAGAREVAFFPPFTGG
jgi:molybdopterin synthase sulfur carrier subunit